ncbi:MAG TPA: DUF1207 domain-containing protein [Calditrichia bacterium]|nr:DUF1207 domain-containing protein [Calditrichota bacterium]HQV30567.1 DUF1207 domain-containing protein [Calditrichia bacterium]
MMRNFNLLFLTVLAASFAALNAQDGRFYTMEDEQYFKPMIANIRTPVNHIRMYRDEPVPFVNSEREGKHTFWDVAFGGYFPLVGVRFGAVGDNPMRRSGLALYVSGSAHVLQDFDAYSSDIINTDYRIGGGAVMRFPASLNFLSLRYRYFHESSHVGDEFTLGASGDDEFRRYNVSYEANEVYLAGDHYANENEGFLTLSYVRLYGGFRALTKEPLFEDFSDPGEEAALKTAGKNESQLGGEVFLQAWRRPYLFIIPQYFVVAADFYRRDRYAVVDPASVWSTHVVAGAILGRYFDNGRTVRWTINYYKGVNPHGQFRSGEIEYVGLDVAIGF